MTNGYQMGCLREVLEAQLHCSELRVYDRPNTAVERLIQLDREQREHVRKSARSLAQESSSAELPETLGYYPMVAVEIETDRFEVEPKQSFGFVQRGPGVYYATISHPELFRSYLESNLELLQQIHGVSFTVGLSGSPIPVVYCGVSDNTLACIEEKIGAPETQAKFPGIDIDWIARSNSFTEGIYPLAMFSGELTDKRADRLRHYTGTKPEDFQPLIILTNYDLHIEAMLEICDELIDQAESGFDEITTSPGLREKRCSCQMPTIHLKNKDGFGITLINIGVGPSNAKNVMDHIAVLRPQAVLMAGHCGGVEQNQRVGQYILAEGYYRDDGILDRIIDPRTPINPVYEINSELRTCLVQMLNIQNGERRKFLQRGSVFSTGDRNWEDDSEKINQILNSGCCAVEMESGVVGALGQLYSIATAAFLCISDLPLTGGVKRAGSSQKFYQETKRVHLRVAIEALRALSGNIAKLHSRKIRQGFRSPPLR